MSRQSRRVISPRMSDTIAGNRSSVFLRRNRSNSVAWFESGSFVRNRTKEKPVPSPRRLVDRTTTVPGEFKRTPSAIITIKGVKRARQQNATTASNMRDRHIFSLSGLSECTPAKRPLTAAITMIADPTTNMSRGHSP